MNLQFYNNIYGYDFSIIVYVYFIHVFYIYEKKILLF